MLLLFLCPVQAPVVESPCGTPSACAGLASGTLTPGSAARHDPFHGFTYVAPCFLEAGAFMSGCTKAAAVMSSAAKGGDVVAKLSPMAPAVKRVMGFDVVAAAQGTCL